MSGRTCWGRRAGPAGMSGRTCRDVGRSLQGCRAVPAGMSGRTWPGMSTAAAGAVGQYLAGHVHRCCRACPPMLPGMSTDAAGDVHTTIPPDSKKDGRAHLVLCLCRPQPLTMTPTNNFHKRCRLVGGWQSRGRRKHTLLTRARLFCAFKGGEVVETSPAGNVH